MEILYVILIGLVVGIVAKFLMPGSDPGGFIVTVLLGIAGSWVGSYLFSMIGVQSGFIGAVIGAMVLLFGYRLVVKQNA